MKKALSHIIACLFIVGLLADAGCTPEDPGFAMTQGSGTRIKNNREPSSDTRSVLLLYFAGRNDLYSYMKEDYADLLSGYIPQDRQSRTDDILLAYIQFPGKNGYADTLSSHLIRLSSNSAGAVLCDTLQTYGKDYPSADSRTLRTVLNDVKKMFPAKGYGMVFSSHATGWLPPGYTSSETTVSRAQDRVAPRQNSLGQAKTGFSNSSVNYEMDLCNFAEAIPMKLDYILLDACLAGGIEVAYELRNACHYIGFSPTEIMAAGYDYKTITQRLLGGNEPDVRGVVEDFFAQYDTPSAQYPYCTASLVDCSSLEPLAEFCADFFATHRMEMSRINPDNVQGYFRFGWHWFYDLEDIIAKAGASKEEMDILAEALSQCVVYNEATPYFISIPIKTHCGMSMYLPCHGNAALDNYYRNLEWNKAVNLL